MRRDSIRESSVRKLGARDYAALLVRAAKKSLRDQITDSAAAVAYYLFLAIPALLLVAVGVFSIFAGPGAIQVVIAKVGTIAPTEVVSLLENSLRRTTESRHGPALIVVGGVLALWTTTGAMTAVIRALNNSYDLRETRGFLRQRLVAILMMLFALVALALVSGLLVLGPVLSAWIGSAIGLQSALGWIWWTVQWPILVLVLLLAFGVILVAGPNLERRVWRFRSFGAAVAVAVWLSASGAFALYVSRFGSYDKTWGSLAAAIVLLTWLWLSALSLLFAAEVNAEVERTRQARR